MSEPSRHAHQGVAKFLAQQVKNARKSRTVIAREAGYASSSSVTALMQGKVRLPRERIVPLADALGVKRDLLLWRWLDAYDPALCRVLEDCRLAAVSSEEFWWLQNIRTWLAPFPTPGWDKETDALMRPVLKALKARAKQNLKPDGP